MGVRQVGKPPRVPGQPEEPCKSWLPCACLALSTVRMYVDPWRCVVCVGVYEGARSVAVAALVAAALASVSSPGFSSLWRLQYEMNH